MTLVRKVSTIRIISGILRWNILETRLYRYLHDFGKQFETFVMCTSKVLFLKEFISLAGERNATKKRGKRNKEKVKFFNEKYNDNENNYDDDDGSNRNTV